MNQNATFFEKLAAKAAASRKKIVLPEGDESRILHAADEVLSSDSVELVIIGDAQKVADFAGAHSLKNLHRTQIVSHQDEELLQKTAAALFELRKAKGLTSEDAHKLVSDDVSYFATLLVQLGYADGMVSGAVHTTADTIRPALQIIKTTPDRKTVSGAFFMCLPTSGRCKNAEEEVLLYADCAVNPNPTPEFIADIAIASAQTAWQFGLDAKVALLSYSTGTSGKGADVDATNEAVKILKERVEAEKLNIDFEGPIQYDAATDKTVARLKMPGSAVAGNATVFVFPDLKSGNITYKAVQRSAGAMAVGPVLQGLRKPVNDLSRGALVEDIVTTIYLTAVQAYM
ncbi:MAG: phosphate acetyltransferase [Candidatus Ancillula trichonymphae]|jgi:phosphate acetyltransferase|nr:phosphate acetyltransferase [Candidatus Ancillula trichonymphae]